MKSLLVKDRGMEVPVVDGLSITIVVGVGDATTVDALPISLGDETARARDARRGD